MNRKGESDEQEEQRTLSPEEYEEWKTHRSEAANERAQKLLDIDHEGGRWDVDVNLPGDISLKVWVLLIVIVIAVVLIYFRDLIYSFFL